MATIKRGGPATELMITRLEELLADKSHPDRERIELLYLYLVMVRAAR